MTYEEASDIYKRITGISVSPDSIESYTKKVGQKVHEMECEHARELMDHPELAAQESEAGMQANGGDADDPIYLEIDGSHLNTREDGCEWKENKLAVAFRQSDIKHCGKEEDSRIQISRKDFVSTIGPVGENLKKFTNLFYGLAVRMGALHAKEVIVLADGASWIRNMVERLLPHAVIILDWYHATEHLWKCAKELYGENSPKAGEWVMRYKALLWEGKVKQVLELLLEEAAEAKKQTPLRDLYSYFNTRKEGMRYDEFRQKGYHIGSGAIESANKYVIQKRMMQAGMRWTFQGANSLAALRIRYLKDCWDPLWKPGGVAWAA